MTDGATLERLAEAGGIEPDYWDIWGNHHRVPGEGKRMLLAALGVLDGDLSPEERFSRLEDADWRRPLPPVLVVAEGQRAQIPLTLSAERAAWPVALEIIDETGDRTELMLRPNDLPVHERRTIDGQEMLRSVVTLPSVMPAGYCSVRLHGQPDRPMRLITAPARCWLPDALQQGGRTWGIAAQLYTLRRPGNWGIGDFTDLAEVVEAAAGLGAGVIGLNPLHALFLAHPEAASPYSPSSRLFLNVLYIDVEAIEELADCAEAQAAVKAAAAEIGELRSRPYVGYRPLKALKLPILELLYAQFQRSAGKAGGSRAAAFAAFRAELGQPLARFALFEALAEHFNGEPWQKWPVAFRNPASPEVAAFARAHAERVCFFEWLQWQADRQLAAAQAKALASGMPVGIYRDLAVGAARDGADAWSDQEVIVQDANVGCPPDPFNMLGQNWGIPPLHPIVLREKGYEPFIAMLRANMRHAGGLRIDHVMGLMHLFWIPVDQPAVMGAYVKYAFDEMLAILALESQRHRCLVVGEDLGTVPPGFRERMAAMNVLSYRVLIFEKDGNRFKGPGEYPELALACVSTHDLATVRGFWEGADLELKARLKLYPSDEAQHNDGGARRWDKTLLLRALAGEGLLPGGIDTENPDGAPMTPALNAALHAYLSRSPARVLLVQIDDLMDEVEQINLPGTVDERPNWRRRLSQTVDALKGAPVVAALAPTLAGRVNGRR